MRFKMLLIFALFFCACHKEDLERYTLDPGEFTENVLQEQNFQMSLIGRLKQNPSTSTLLALVKTREIFAQKYLEDLVNLKLSDQQPHLYTLSESHSKSLMTIDLLAGLDYEKALIEMLVNSDQNMLAFHIRASSNSGLANPQLRSWTETKLPQLRNNLKESQNLK